MTEDEWLACEEPIRMFEFLHRKASDRKLRLLACANVRGFRQHLGAHSAQELLDTFEAYTDGLALYSEVDAMRSAVNELARALRSDSEPRAALDACLDLTRMAVNDSSAYWGCRSVASDVGRIEVLALRAAKVEPSSAEYSAALGQALSRSASLSRDVFGNPFRPVAVDPAWRTDTALSLARGMYESRDFSAMPILADALQDAGCDNPDVLDHCRDAAATHVRGCWVVDLVLEKV